MKPDLPYRDRTEAGHRLAAELGHKSKPDALALGLTRGGVPVATEVASALQAALDVIVVRRLGVPFRQGLAMGAIAGDGTQVLDKDLVHDLHIPNKDVQLRSGAAEALFTRALPDWASEGDLENADA